VPGSTVDATFAGRPPAQRAIYDAIEAHVRSLGPVHADAVSVGVFLKNKGTFAEVRPKSRWLSLELAFPYPMTSPRFTRVLRASAVRTIHVVRLTEVDDVDDEVRDWLTAAYDAAG
jgi:Domain of unknown function (DUF5655)